MYHDDESDCINAHDINDDDQDAHTSIDGNAEDSNEKDSRNSNNINNIIHKKNAGQKCNKTLWHCYK